MSSIRPIITLTIIALVGVFLFRKINEGPAQIASNDATFQSAPTTAAPPLAMSTPDATGGMSAPAWSGGTTVAEPPAPKWADPVTDETASAMPPIETAPVAQNILMQSTPDGMQAIANSSEGTNVPGLPPIPALPPLADATPPVGTAPATAPTFPAAPLDPPASIPTARYDSDNSAEEMTQPTATPFAATGSDATTPAVPALPVAEATSPEDRYAAATTTPEAASTVQTAAHTPAAAASPLAASWPEIQSALDRQELAQAHEMLSQFYGNPSLSPTESQQVEALLSQLAGTVVYSTEHRLEPPYVVHPGDTLETIAAKYEVPWQLLAKINGIPASNLVQPGQELKVVHGPFSAIVELSRGQLTLLLGDRYAGRFPVITEPTAATCEGQWMLEQKLVNPSSPGDGVVSASYDASTAPVDRTLVLRSESTSAGVATISIASGVPTPSGPTAVAPAAFRISPQDAEELADILSVGSRITIRK